MTTFINRLFGCCRQKRPATPQNVDKEASRKLLPGKPSQEVYITIHADRIAKEREGALLGTAEAMTGLYR